MLRGLAVAPAGPEGVQRVVKSRFPTFPQTARSVEEEALFWRDWYIACADLTEEALEAGMTAWLRRSPPEKWLPKPGELRDMAIQTPTRTAEAYRRARAAAEAARERDAPQAKRVDPELVKAQMIQFGRDMAGNKDLNRMRRASWMTDADWTKARERG